MPDADRRALAQAVSEVLHYLWDPIGVAGVPQARDEYDSYVPEICTLLSQGADQATVATTLREISGQRMGLDDTDALAEQAARRLMAWREVITR
ncbi:hypothetical protein FHR47_003189 [Xanthomonas arboricola]|nr:hypothetical protein [Xanthomonas cannabis]